MAEFREDKDVKKHLTRKLVGNTVCPVRTCPATDQRILHKSAVKSEYSGRRMGENKLEECRRKVYCI